MKSAHPFLLAFLSLAGVAHPQTQVFDFESGLQSWICDYADYGVGREADMGLKFGHDTMPGVLPRQKGIVFDGNNLSDDLFYFAKREITGLVPNASYSRWSCIADSQLPYRVRRSWAA
jgi:hypothetical protein